MTVSSTVRRAGPYVGNGVATSFAFAYKVFLASEVVVTKAVVATGIESVLVLNTDYVVVLNTDQNNNPGGSITHPISGSPMASTHTLTLTSDVLKTQGTDIQNAGGFFPEVIEDALDREMIVTQQEAEKVNRTLRFPVSDAPANVNLPAVAQRASKFLAFDASGVPIAATSVTGTPVTPFMATVLDDTTAPAARATLGSTAVGDAVYTAADAVAARATLGVEAANPTLNTISGNVTLVAGDIRKVNLITATATVTLPAVSALADGNKLYFKSSTEANVQLAPAGTDTIDGVNANYRIPSFCDCVIMRTGAGAFVLLEKPDVSVGDWSWAGYSTAKRGWLKAGTGNQSRTTLAGLFAEYGTTWGAGDGSTTFGIPDGKGRAPVQAGTGTVIATGVDADVDITANTLAVASNTNTWITGMAVFFNLTSGTITGLVDNTTYFVIRNTATTIKMAATLADAQNGTAIDFTAKSSPVWDITHTYVARTLGEYGGEQTHAMSSTELLAHTHTTGFVTNGGAGSTRSSVANNTDTAGAITGSAGGNAAMNIMSPFLVGELYIKT